MLSDKRAETKWWHKTLGGRSSEGGFYLRVWQFFFNRRGKERRKGIGCLVRRRENNGIGYREGRGKGGRSG